jgi:hypothetical protein
MRETRSAALSAKEYEVSKYMGVGGLAWARADAVTGNPTAAAGIVTGMAVANALATMAIANAVEINLFFIFLLL